MNQINPNNEIKSSTKTKAKPRILYILHCYHNHAGTEEHTRTLAGELSDEFEISLAFPEHGHVHLLRSGHDLVSLPGNAVPWPLAPYRAPVLESSILKILDLVKPDLIHIQHFFNWPLGIIELLAAAGKPTIATYHDYYALTPYYTLEKNTDPLDTTSSDYSKRTFRSDISKYLEQRREILQRGLAKLECHLTPSRFAAGILNQVFPFNYKVIEHGISHFNIKKKPSMDSRLRFGFVGTLLPQKGWVSLLNAFKDLLKKTDRATLSIYGGGQKVETTDNAISFHGIYEQSELPEIFSNIDIGIIPSIFPETFSLVLSEMWMAGLPVAVSDIGALGERVSDGINGKKFLPGDSEDMTKTLLWFLENESWRDWKIPRPRVVNEMVEEYRVLYNSLIKQG